MAGRPRPRARHIRTATGTGTFQRWPRRENDAGGNSGAAASGHGCAAASCWSRRHLLGSPMRTPALALAAALVALGGGATAARGEAAPAPAGPVSAADGKVQVSLV